MRESGSGSRSADWVTSVAAGGCSVGRGVAGTGLRVEGRRWTVEGWGLEDDGGG